MKKPALARDALQQVEEAPMESIDAVRSLQPGDPVRTAYRAAGCRSHVVPEPPRYKLLPFTFLAFKNGHVTEAFKEGPMNATKPAPTLPALRRHGLFIPQLHHGHK